jgi:hypothetical protein
MDFDQNPSKWFEMGCPKHVLVKNTILGLLTGLRPGLKSVSDFGCFGQAHFDGF